VFTPKDDVVARGRKTIIRRKRLSDLAQDYSWRTDEELAQYDAAPPLRLPLQEFARTWESEMRFTDAPLRNMAIEEETGQRIGNIMYYNVDRWRQEAELGISIGLRYYWGQGYGSDAVRAIVRYLFQTTQLQRIYLHTLNWNVRAQKAFQKAGFVPCGTSFRGPHTFIVMETLRPHWAQLPHPRQR